MGKIISKFWRKPSTIEQLERIDKEIDSLVHLKRRDGELEKQYVGTLVLYSVIIYFVMALFFYFYFIPDGWTGRLIQILPLLLFPFLIWLVRRLIRLYFVKRVSRCQMQLNDLRAEKKKVLEDVKEKESYKKAKEILDKYDPAPVSPPPAPMTSPVPTGLPPGITPVIRQRGPVGRGRGRGRGMPTPVISPNRQPTLPPGTPWTPQNSSQNIVSRPLSTVRPVLQRERGTMDKLVDYLVGDGPSHRFALICKHCCSHNGMALQEEFEYLAFRCPYCGTFNPSRKTRPNAPRLLDSGPSSSADQASNGESESDSEEDLSSSDQPHIQMVTTTETEVSSEPTPSASTLTDLTRVPEEEYQPTAEEQSPVDDNNEATGLETTELDQKPEIS